MHVHATQDEDRSHCLFYKTAMPDKEVFMATCCIRAPGFHMEHTGVTSLPHVPITGSRTTAVWCFNPITGQLLIGSTESAVPKRRMAAVLSFTVGQARFAMDLPSTHHHCTINLR